MTTRTGTGLDNEPWTRLEAPATSWVIIERYDSASASSVSVPPENEKAPEAMRTYER